MIDFFLGITNSCNLNCSWCAHEHLRMMQPDYVMSSDEFETWFRYTSNAGYRFSSLDFNGLGEPTLYPDIDFLKYMIIKCHKFTDNVNILTNGMLTDVIDKIALLCENVTISLYKKDQVPSDELTYLKSKYPRIVHIRDDIELHDMRYPPINIDVDENAVCGCSGSGYTMETVFLVCGTWCPEIRKDGHYHTSLCENYLDNMKLSDYGRATFGMCTKCHANTSIPFRRVMR